MAGWALTTTEGSHAETPSRRWVRLGTYVAVEMLLNHRDLALQDPDVVAAALEHFHQKPALGFSDCLLLEIARKAGHPPLGTFDKALSKLEGAQRP